MSSCVASVCASILAAAPILAQEGGAHPPTGAAAGAPARHENKVTDAAKAAFERIEKVHYCAVSAGLKELTGTLEMKMDMPDMDPGEMAGMPSMSFTYDVAFKAPTDLKIKVAKSADGPMAMMAGGMRRAAEGLMRASLGLAKPSDDDEYDADAKTVDGKTVLTLVRYAKNVETRRETMTLDDLGRIDTLATVAKPGADGPGGPPRGGMGGGMGGMGGARGGGGDEAMTTKFTYAKEKDRWLVQKMSSKGEMGTAEIVPEYTEAGGFKLMSAFALKGDERMGSMNFGFRFTDLSVNGKKVELPAAKAGGTGK